MLARQKIGQQFFGVSNLLHVPSDAGTRFGITKLFLMASHALAHTDRDQTVTILADLVRFE